MNSTELINETKNMFLYIFCLVNKITVSLMILYSFVVPGLPSSPMNLTATCVFAQDLMVSWTWRGNESEEITAFELTYQPLRHSGHTYWIVSVLPINQRSWQLKDLHPKTTYRIFVFAVNHLGSSNSSNILNVTTLSG